MTWMDHTNLWKTRERMGGNAPNSVEVAVEFYQANAEVPGVRHIRGRTGQNNSKVSEGKQSVWPYYRP